MSSKFLRFCLSALTLPLLISQGQGQRKLTNELYVSNFNNNTITVYDATTGNFLRTAVQGGPELSGANGFTIAQDGSFFVAGQFSNNIVHYSAQGQLLKILDPSNLAGISSPQGVNFGPDGLLYVASFDNDKIVRFDVATGEFRDMFVQVQLAGVPHMGPVEPSFGPDCNLVVTSFDGQRILKYQGPVAKSSQSCAPVSSSPGTLLAVYDLPSNGVPNAYASGANFGAQFFVDAINAATLTGEIQQFTQTGTFVSQFVPNGAAGLTLPGGIAIGPDNNLYIANIKVDANFQDVGSEILRFDPVNGQFVGVFVPAGVGLNVPFAMRFGPGRRQRSD